MRTLYRAAAALAFLLSALGPAGAATSGDVIAQAAATQGTLTGRVTNSRGDGLSAAIVTVSGGATTLTATTGADGAFTLAVPPGVYSVVVNRGGYQTSQSDDVAVVAGGTARLAIALNESSTQSLRVIGRVSTSTNRNPINTNVAAVSTLSNAVIAERVPTNLNDVATELPGVSIARTTGATANTFFETRGFFIQQKVNIDGHPVASGQFGNWNTNYASPFLFGQIEVLKGAGLNGPTAGESAIGTINLRTRDFTNANTFEITTGVDSYTGSYLNLFGSANLLHGRLSVLAARSNSGYNGPWDGYFTNRIAAAPNLSGLPVGTYQVPSPNGLVQFQGDLSQKYGLQGELAKIRYRLSESTSVTFEYLGLQGQYFPQGGAYSSYAGHVNIANCFTGGVAQFSPAGCGVTSTYNAPYAQSAAGTQGEGYQWFPNSYVQNNEPQFSAELRTSYKNDTILLRPYTAEINRFINGQYEVLYPGNNGPWFMVTSTANCQVNFVAASAANGGAKGPCFTQNSQYNSPSYVGANPGNLRFIFPTTPNAPSCSLAAPCWTTSSVASNDGTFAYGTPFSQPERDYLHGFTFSYIHPVGDNVYNFSWDANIENSTFYSGDTNPKPAGCKYVIGSGVANDPAKPYYQPTCTLGVTPNTPIGFLPKTALGYPPTNIRKNDFALTGQFQLTPKLQLAVGNYLSVYKPDAQVEDPNVLAAYSTGGNIPAAAPVSLIHTGKTIVHYDPHVGVLLRPSRDVSLRATVGSSITMPYASVISGIDRIDLPNGANSQTYTLTQANPTLLPETQMSYNLGGDVRLRDGGLLSADVYDITIFNAFAANTVPLTGAALATAQSTAPGAAGGYFNNKTINVGQLRAYGLELSIAKNPVLGFGYRFTGSLQRAFFDKIPKSVYLAGQTALIAGKQLDGLNGSISVPYAKGYGEVRWALPADSLITFGADYEGNNNSTYGPPITLFNSTIKFPIVKGIPLQIAIDNLFNLNTGSTLGRALLNQGSQSVRFGCNAAGTVCSYSGSPKSLQFVYPRNVRVQLSKRI